MTNEAKRSEESVLADLLSRPLSAAMVTAIVMRYHYQGCQIPTESRHMITEIVNLHMQSLGIALGNLELMYRRTKDPAT